MTLDLKKKKAAPAILPSLPLTLIKKKAWSKSHLLFSKVEKEIKLSQIPFLRLRLASPQQIKKWVQRSLPNGEKIGEVSKANIFDANTDRPIKNGLFCERVFGPLKDFQCACGNLKSEVDGELCLTCGVQFTSSQSRRYQMGYIQLITPVIHFWYFKKGPRSYLSVLLNLKRKDLQALTTCEERLSFNSQAFQQELLLQNIWPLLTKKFFPGQIICKNPKKGLGPKKSQKDPLRKAVKKKNYRSKYLLKEVSVVNKLIKKGPFTFQIPFEKALIQHKLKIHEVVKVKNPLSPTLLGPKTPFQENGGLKKNNKGTSFFLAPEKIKTLSGLFPKGKNRFEGGASFLKNRKKNLEKSFLFFKKTWGLKKILGYRAINQDEMLRGSFAFKTSSEELSLAKVFSPPFLKEGLKLKSSIEKKKGGEKKGPFKNPFDLKKRFFLSKLFQGPQDLVEGFDKKPATLLRNPLGNLKYFSYLLLKLSYCWQISALLFQLKKFKVSLKPLLKTSSLVLPPRQPGLIYYLPKSLQNRQTGGKKKAPRGIFTLTFLPSLGKTSKKAGFFDLRLPKNLRKLNLTSLIRQKNFSKKVGLELSKKIFAFLQRLNKATFLKRLTLINNYYTLSQALQWKSEEDWQIFLNYMAPTADNKDFLIPTYYQRGLFSTLLGTGTGSIKILLSCFTTCKQQSGLFPPGDFQSFPKRNPLSLLVKSLRTSFLKMNSKIEKVEQEWKSFTLKSNPGSSFRLFRSSKPQTFEILKEGHRKYRNLTRGLILRKKKLRRLKLVMALMQNRVLPEWMVLSVLPVLPPTLRPILTLENEERAVSDLTSLYQIILARNNRLKRFGKNHAFLHMSPRHKLALRLLQESVNALIEGSPNLSPPSTTPSPPRALKSLSDMLKGKKGRFRQNLLGKRVDYSGRSVIVVGPQLKLHQCGIPVEMALILFQPFVIRRLLFLGIAWNFNSAKKLLFSRSEKVLKILQEVMENRPVFLNRAPTLHRLGIQAFQPLLVSGRAILLHPLVCTAFNADFDGDQMGVHIPLSWKACSEAWKLMGSRNHLLSSATGEPILLPSQDMVLGSYYLTTLDHVQSRKKIERASFFLPRTGKEASPKNTLFPYGKHSHFKTKWGWDWFLPRLKKGKFFLKSWRPKSTLPEKQSRVEKYYGTKEQVFQSLNQQRIHLHSSIWFKWNPFFEFSAKSEGILETRLDKFGNRLFIKPTSQSYGNLNFEKTWVYIKTTPGRVLMNHFIFEAQSQTNLKDSPLTKAPFDPF